MAVNAVDLYTAGAGQMAPDSEDELTRRRREARARLAAALQPQKIGHVTQGLAQMANAGLAGWEEGAAAKEAKDNRAALAETMARMWPGGSPVGGGTATGIPPAAAAPAAPPPVADSGPVDPAIAQRFGVGAIDVSPDFGSRGQPTEYPAPPPPPAPMGLADAGDPMRQQPAPAGPTPLTAEMARILARDNAPTPPPAPPAAPTQQPMVAEAPPAPPAARPAGMMRLGAELPPPTQAPPVEGVMPGIPPAAPPPAPFAAPDYRGQGGPASIRYNNPGAQYPGPSAQKFGTTGTETIGGGHQIAVFPDAVSGAAATFDLLDRRYTGKPLAQAIATWSGGNSSPAYTASVAKDIGLAPNTVLTPELLRDPAVAIPLAKAMAKVEAGREHPMPAEGWQAAHAKAFGGGTDTAAAPKAQGMIQMAQSGQAMTPELFKQLALRNPQLAQQLLMQEYATRRNEPDKELDREHKRLQIESARRSLEAGPGEIKVNPKTGRYFNNKGELPNQGNGGDELQDVANLEFAKKSHEYLQVAAKEHASARDLSRTLDDLKAIAPYAQTGFGAEQILTMRKAASALGMSVDPKIGATELFRALSQEGILSAAQKLKPLSNSDIAFVQKGLATIQSDPSSVPLIAAGLGAVAKRTAMAQELAMEQLKRGRPPDYAAIQQVVDQQLPSPIQAQFGGGQGRPQNTAAPQAPSAWGNVAFPGQSAPPQQAAPQQAPTAPAEVPSAAVAQLRQDASPLRRKQFDEVFGPGAAARALGGR